MRPVLDKDALHVGAVVMAVSVPVALRERLRKAAADDGFGRGGLFSKYVAALLASALDARDAELAAERKERRR